jgi:hypothetical protein
MRFSLGITIIFCTLSGSAVLAQSYSHEFVNPDGSSVMCSTSLGGRTGQTECANVPRDARLKHYKNLTKIAERREYCAALTKPPHPLDMFKPEYSWEAFARCMGR